MRARETESSSGMAWTDCDEGAGASKSFVVQLICMYAQLDDCHVRAMRSFFVRLVYRCQSKQIMCSTRECCVNGILCLVFFFCFYSSFESDKLTRTLWHRSTSRCRFHFRKRISLVFIQLLVWLESLLSIAWCVCARRVSVNCFAWI